MSYCRNCGAETNFDTGMCPKCLNNIYPENSTSKKWSVLAIIAFNVNVIAFAFNVFFVILNFTSGILFLYVWGLYLALGFFANLVCLALSIAAVCITMQQRQRGKGLAIAGLIISVLSFCITIAILSFPFILRLL